MSLGSMITKARKDAAVSIDDLSATTNIRATLIREMENNDFHNCGGETYARGHLRNIATKLGADPSIFLSAFEEEQIHSTKTMSDLLVENSVMNQPDQPRKVSWKILASISLVALLLVGISQIVISQTSNSDLVLPTPAASASASPTPVAEPTSENTLSQTPASDVEVVISATRSKSWLFVSDAGSKTLFSGQIQKGEIKTFTTDISINVRVGNAGGVDFRVNGKEINSVGTDGEVVNLSFGVDS